MADFDFNEQPALARLFTHLLEATPWVETTLEGADFYLPMPQSSQRLHLRGYNQALLLVRELNTTRTRKGLFLRLVDTPARHGLNRAPRLTSLNETFAAYPIKVLAVKGARLVRVGDVMTTGAFLNTATRGLKAAGAAHIAGLVVVRTE